MLPQKCIYFFYRLMQMGPRTASWLLFNRFKKKLFIRRWGKKGPAGWQYHTWSDLEKKHKTGEFPAFLQHLKAHDFCGKILKDQLFIHALPPCTQDRENIFDRADQAAQSRFTVLGFGTFHKPDTSWHEDITTKKPSPTAWTTDFYADITIPETTTHLSEQRIPDIKVPWELSRLQHFFYLGLGYQAARNLNDCHRASIYAKTFVQHTKDWLDCNPFLRGVNWANPMEVAIRSINGIWAFHFFKNEPSIGIDFWQRYICMLYDHALYLENNWEVSDKPNNHYLSDLVGFLYLCSFLVNIKKYYQTRKAIAKQLFNQFNQQLLPDGTSYEGSTAYHGLDTELLLHTIMLCKHNKIPTPTHIKQTYQKMLQFHAHCADQAGNCAQIGDNDGGRIVAGIATNNNPNTTARSYPDFGLTIINNNQWHITFRHAMFTNHQPTGHFHHDQLSITLSIDGIPILIDPGTYLYTSYPSLRNYFRSYAAHNTLFIPTMVPVNLFQLPRNNHSNAPNLIEQNESLSIHDFNTQWQTIGLTAHRQLIFQPQHKRLEIKDWWDINEEKNENTCNKRLQWAFHFSPQITLEQADTHTWLMLKKTQHVATFSSTLIMHRLDDFFSPTYGQCFNGTMLTTSPCSQTQQHSIIQIPY